MSHGGKREGAGRPAGSHNKATEEIREVARTYTASAMKELARLALQAESETARVAAIREILDRGYGKSVQAIESTAEVIHKYVSRIPEPATNADTWQQQHKPQTTLQ